MSKTAAPRDLFDYPTDRLYLDSATYGLPPSATTRALREALDAWRDGSARWIEDWDVAGESSRRLLAEMIGAGSRSVSLQPAVSVASGIVATAVPDGGEVLLAEGDFTSVSYPFVAAAEAGRCEEGIGWRAVPLERLADSVRPETSMVAVSLVQSADGRVVDLAALRSACDVHNARLYVDASQALGMLPVNVDSPSIDYLSAVGYKWLCCPRGTAWLYVHPDLHDEPWPVAASWRGGDDPYGRYYFNSGDALGLANDAARFDVSLAACVGGCQALFGGSFVSRRGDSFSHRPRCGVSLRGASRPTGARCQHRHGEGPWRRRGATGSGGGADPRGRTRRQGARRLSPLQHSGRGRAGGVGAAPFSRLVRPSRRSSRPG